MRVIVCLTLTALAELGPLSISRSLGDMEALRGEYIDVEVAEVALPRGDRTEAGEQGLLGMVILGPLGGGRLKCEGSGAVLGPAGTSALLVAFGKSRVHELSTVTLVLGVSGLEMSDLASAVLVIEADEAVVQTDSVDAVDTREGL